jgi:hypothetical protein
VQLVRFCCHLVRRPTGARRERRCRHPLGGGPVDQPARAGLRALGAHGAVGYGAAGRRLRRFPPRRGGPVLAGHRRRPLRGSSRWGARGAVRRGRARIERHPRAKRDADRGIASSAAAGRASLPPWRRRKDDPARVWEVRGRGAAQVERVPGAPFAGAPRWKRRRRQDRRPARVGDRGQPPRLVGGRRAASARRALAAKGAPLVSEVAERVGYSSVSAFHRAFSKRAGGPPAALRPGGR